MTVIPGLMGTNADSLGWHGNAVFLSGRVRALSCRVHALPGLEQRGMVLARLLHLPTGETFVCCAAHFGLLARFRRVQAAAAVAAMAAMRLDGDGLLFLGDTNEWRRDGPASSLAPLLSVGLRGPRVPTFPAFAPSLGLDRVMSDRPLGFVGHSPGIYARASDHLPLVVEVGNARGAG